MPNTVCQRNECKSNRLLTVHARAKDMHWYKIMGRECENGYGSTFSSDSDTTTFTACLDCGQMQGEFPEPLMFLEPDYIDPDD